ncbi:hypothetical protein E2562_007629 [Oryza meyeriana var. granulata]|uniref:Photosystem II 10 kDa polypeptide, chloroplastic n=1 Tax=Oryza meyeriana var. granulata TaxID=110450 RepID=A0A6G1DWS4_9ORYZ|nr:hypothetical protein E2562_007629 [Oryza meyeriana var. granulata]
MRTRPFTTSFKKTSWNTCGNVMETKLQILGKGVYQFASKYGANVDAYTPINSPEEWTPSGDVYTGGKTGLLLWAVTLAGILLAGALLVYNTSALAS